jgi:hypothetical protein
MGPVLIACLLAVLLIPPGGAWLARLWRQRRTRLWSGAVLISCAVGGLWTIVFKSYQVAHLPTGRYSPYLILKIEATGRLLKIVTQMIDGFAYDDKTPTLIFTVWAISIGLLLIGAFAWSSRLDRWRLAGLIAAVLAIPVIVDLGATNTYGFSFYGRYIFPLAVGIPLLAAFCLARSEVFTRAKQASLARALIVTLLPFQLISIGYMMDRWQSGAGPGHSLDPLRGHWLPVTGPALPLLLAVAGIGLLGFMAWRAVEPVDDRPEELPRPAVEPQGVPAAQAGRQG